MPGLSFACSVGRSSLCAANDLGDGSLADTVSSSPLPSAASRSDGLFRRASHPPDCLLSELASNFSCRKTGFPLTYFRTWQALVELRCELLS